MSADGIGGVWTFALDLCRALRVDVHLATMGTALQPAQQRDAAGIRTLMLHESSLKLEWMDSPWADVDRAGEWLLSLAAKVKPDVVHLNHLCHADLPWPAPVVLTGHSSVLSWWRAVKGEEAPASWSEYRERVHRSLRSAGVVTAPTRWMLHQLLEALPAVQRRARVIPNGRDPRLFQPRDKQPYIFAAGRLWDEAKNLQALNAAAPHLPWPVYVAGATRAPDGQHTAAPAVRLLGTLGPPELAARLAHASIYALPARYEPFGLSILEAALSGCALVLGDIPSLRENWDGAAAFVPPGDTLELRRCLNHLIADQPRRERLGQLALERSRRFHLQPMASAYLDAYRQARPVTACAS